MSWDALLIGVVAAALLAATVVARRQHRRAERWRICAEEADAWSNEYQSERDVFARQYDELVAQNQELRATRSTLQDLVALRTRQLLAVNYSFIAYNVRYRRD